MMVERPVGLNDELKMYIPIVCLGTFCIVEAFVLNTVYTLCVSRPPEFKRIYISHERITHLLKLEYRSTPHTRLIFGRLLC